ncbi:D-alanyl-D-alanine carboxypeptidase family protein [Paenibacillus filicis]|uniref:D-alanyl-D-alanine carboxypeptidase family protein n=1 Tax=Paenibacillus filicis TaxID=669464 RepID=A0ABU9DML7_9BACL
MSLKRVHVAVLALFGIVLAVCWQHADQIRPYAVSVWEAARQTANPLSGPQIKGQAGLVINAGTGETLYAKHENERMYPASTTKILTALIALEQAKPDEPVVVGDEVNLREPDEASAGLRAGQRLTMRDLLAAMLLPSGNDAARTIAVFVGRKACGSKQTSAQALDCFAGLMNSKAAKLGAKHSHFVNPNGLHDPQHYSTARDLAIIARKAMEMDEFRQIVAVNEYKATVGASGKTVMTAAGGGGQTFRYANRNLLLQADSGFYMQGVNGIKTGFTDQAGYCLVASARQGREEIISVVLHSTQTEVWTDSKSLLEYGLGF